MYLPNLQDRQVIFGEYYLKCGDGDVSDSIQDASHIILGALSGGSFYAESHNNSDRYSLIFTENDHKAWM
jgi:hypothetical protein